MASSSPQRPFLLAGLTACALLLLLAAFSASSRRQQQQPDLYLSSSLAPVARGPRMAIRNTRVCAEEAAATTEKKPIVFINKFKRPDSPVRIRLARKGKHKAPFYRIVVQDSRRIPNGRFLENVGFYDPLKTTGKVSLNIDRIKYWIGVGAKPSQTVARFLELVGIETA
eukprot:CAMPEP_0114515974 /NCGR_PEP_ID=MMETSP0109-20121206/17064_1 /TAXON_ID=29199 /ORGANISM="Chlorarachnion reptans, Strain CCCM449" /LENGTH=168 /DNA_ID=CAMNT_0001696299 /DNA_START=59 /DNA_END=565 /DNA_ORIENTATION=-